MPQYELNFRDYLRIFRKRRLTIIFTFLLVTAFGIFTTPKSEPVYHAVTTIKIEERKTVGGMLTDQVVYNPADRMESETKIIRGYQIMKGAALKLGLIDGSSSTDEINEAVSGLQGAIATERVGSATNMISIIAAADEPKKAMDMANTVAEVYINDNLREKAKEARNARIFIEEQLTAIEERMRKIEKELRQAGVMEEGKKAAGSLQEKLSEMQFRLNELLQRYTDKHPAVLQLKDQISEMESNMRQQGVSGEEMEYMRLLREDEANKKLYTMFKEKLEEARISEAQKVSDISVVDPAIMPAGSAGGDRRSGAMLSGLLGIVVGIVLAFVVESLDTSIGTIEDVENITKLSVLGVVPSIRIRPREDEKNILKRWLRAAFPFLEKRLDEPYVRLIVHNDPKSPISEAYRAIRTNLKLNPAMKSILVTSSHTGEGKTSIVTNLGIAIAQTGARVVLVSSDMRRPALARTFGVEEEPGLSEVIGGSVDLDTALRSVSDMMLGEIKLDKIMESPGIENVFILSAGRLPINPAELLESRDFRDIIEELKRRFDVVILDSPPVLPVTDAVLLAGRVDGVIMAYEAGRTARSALARAKTQIEASGTKILGIVLNHIKAETEMPPGQTYYYRYKYEERPDKKKKIS